MKPLTLLTKAKSLNENPFSNTAEVDFETGESDLVWCLGLIPNSAGFLTSAPGTVFDRSFSSAITTGFSGNGKVFVQCGTSLYRCDVGSTAVITGAVLAGPVCGVVTEIDTRFTDGITAWKVLHGSDAAVVCTVGVHSNPTTSVVYNAMPVFSKAFVHGGALAVVTGEFVRFSEINHYDCFDYKDTYIWAGGTIRDAGSIPGCVVVLTDRKAIVVTGYNKTDFKYADYPVKPKGNTLQSVFTSSTGWVHIFMGEGGIYTVDQQGKLTNQVDGKVNADSFTDAYTGSAVTSQGYFCSSETLGVHFSTETGGFFRLVGSSDKFVPGGYVLSGSDLCTIGQCVEECSFALPPTTFGTSKLKRVNAILVSGSFSGTMTITVQSDDGAFVLAEETFTGLVQDKRVQGFASLLSSNVKVSVSFTGPFFMLTKLSAIITVTPRY